MSYLGWLLKERVESFAKQLCTFSCFAETDPSLIARNSTTMALRWFFSCDCESAPASLGASISVICQQERRIGTHEENQTSRVLESSFWVDCIDFIAGDAVCFQAEDINSPSGWGKYNQVCWRIGWLTWKDLRVTNAFYVSQEDCFTEMESLCCGLGRVFTNLVMLMANIVMSKYITLCSLLQTLAYFDQTNPDSVFLAP